MPPSLHQVLAAQPVSASAPCRIDMGGTLDISTFHLPLRRHAPCTVNIAMALRTRVVTCSPMAWGQVKVSSRGFESAVFPTNRAPFRHPLGLMFAIAAFLRCRRRSHPDRLGISAAQRPSAGPRRRLWPWWPPCRPPLNGHGAKAPAFPSGNRLAGPRHRSRCRRGALAGSRTSWPPPLAGSTSGIGSRGSGSPPFARRRCPPAPGDESLADHLLLAYCGVPHESKDVNGRWVQQFLAGEKRASLGGDRGLDAPICRRPVCPRF